MTLVSKTKLRGTMGHRKWGIMGHCPIVPHNVPDNAIVDLEDIKVILGAPIKCGTTKRQNSSLRFAYNFSNLIIK